MQTIPRLYICIFTVFLFVSSCFFLLLLLVLFFFLPPPTPTPPTGQLLTLETPIYTHTPVVDVIVNIQTLALFFLSLFLNPARFVGQLLNTKSLLIKRSEPFLIFFCLKKRRTSKDKEEKKRKMLLYFFNFSYLSERREERSCQKHPGLSLLI